jgi:polyisoprenoid-binding protein YceI
MATTSITTFDRFNYPRTMPQMNQNFLASAISLLLFAGSSAFAQTSTWTIDTNQTQVEFQVHRVPVSNVRGFFSGITGTVNWDEKNPSKSHVEVTIPTSSLSTNNAMRDADLKSPNFFNVEKFPTMTFKSTAVSSTPGKLQVTGDLKLAGVTKSVTLMVDGPTPPTKMGKLIIGFTATGTLKRSDFAFAPKYPAVILGDEIKFIIDLEADQ